MMKLYGTPPTRAIRAMWLINELDLDREIVTVDMGIGEHAGAELRALNPAGKLPFLVDGEDVISESCAIQLYLAENYSDGELMPRDLSERGQIYRWMFFLATEIEQPLWRIALHTAMYQEEDRLAAELPLATRDCKAMLAVLENHMKDRRFVVGDKLTVADFNAAYTLDWAREAGMLGEFPTLTAYVEQMYARPKAPVTIEEGFA
ncbi:glutathione S-transferase family protein [Erythrobacter sp. YT30]|uniref:glutathione S-transferase family protein n=1 Tax=Erythrobacter sp. YT30 TaxID=1735012 RepID=UPI00076CE816|nr:glutathione S-transferase family protein [Erythrobacter sp. YT30]KWV91050.1 glutathione S-transferase [Erythrobacter sp. YT30]